MVGFIHDEEGADAGIGAQARDLAFDLAMERRAGAFDGEPHLPGDGLVEIHDVARGERDVDDAIEAGVQLGQDFATRAGFPAATVAGHKADAAQVEQMREAHLEFATGGGGKQILGRDLVAEGMLGEGEMFAVHRQSSFNFRNGSPGGG